MKSVMRMCLGLVLLTGCQVATGLSDLALVEQEDGGPGVAGQPAKGGSGGGGEGGSGGEIAKGGAGGESGKGGAGGEGPKADAGGNGGNGGHAGEGDNDEPVKPVVPAEGGQGANHSDGGQAGAPPPAAAGSGGVGGGNAGSGGAAGVKPPAPCEHPGTACDLVNTCGCEGDMVCGIVKPADKLEIGCKSRVGPIALGNSCSGIDDCVPGAVCIGGTDTAICRRACTQDSQCGAHSACLHIKDFDDLGFCAETCVTHSDCAATNCCLPSTEGVNFCASANACPDLGPASGTKKVGEACTAASECQSNNCHAGVCYDTHADGTTCTRDLDCAGHTCVSEFRDGTSKVCISAREACTKMNIDDCYIDLTVAACQLTNKCSATKLSSFDACVRNNCASAAKDYPLSQCQSAHSGFMGDIACPTPDTKP